VRLTLFDLNTGGHHVRYLRRFAEALRPSFEVTIAAPGEVVQELGDLDVGFKELRDSRQAQLCSLRASEDPPGALSRLLYEKLPSLTPTYRRIAAEEARLVREVAAEPGTDHVVLTCADFVLRELVRGPRVGAEVTVCIFFASAHYPSVFDTPLSVRERLGTARLERNVARWRRRSDAHAVFALDPVVARRWAARGGAPAYWLPEPPVAKVEVPPPERRAGCALYGALARRKGIDLLADAVALERTELRVVLAGTVAPGYGPEFERLVAVMEDAGARVEAGTRRHSEQEGLRVLAQARCAVLPYPRHLGMSRVLVEAASVGTPVVVHRGGLLGHLVDEHGLGHTLDCSDAHALREAVLAFAEDAALVASYQPALRAFADRFSPDRFKAAITAPFAAKEPVHPLASLL
jgi:glycosyltransferase involved in cell wall biosynthesis